MYTGTTSELAYNLDLLPPKPKLPFRYLKKGVHEFYRKFVPIWLLTTLWSFKK